MCEFHVVEHPDGSLANQSHGPARPACVVFPFFLYFPFVTSSRPIMLFSNFDKHNERIITQGKSKSNKKIQLLGFQTRM